MSKFLDNNGLLYFWNKIKAYVLANKVAVDASINSTSENPVQNKAINSALNNKVDKVAGKGLSTEDFTTADKTKLTNISANAEVNQNAFSNVKVGNTTVAADSKTDTLNLVAGSNKVTITANADNDTITIDASGAVTGVKGDSESTYRSGDVNITKANIGLGNVDNTADANKNVKTATTLSTARYIEGVSFNGSGNTSLYATCTTASATAAKVATITPTMTFSLVTGARVIVNFTNSIGVASATLDVNSTGAKPIYYNGAALAANLTDAGGTYEFVYNGTQWELIGDLDTNGSYTVFTGKPTANQTPSFGDKFTIQQISQDAVGQVSGTDRTVKIPDTVASATVNGLMSSTMYSKLNGLPSSSMLQSIYATKAEITNMYKYKGSVATVNDLPSSGQTTGDVYNIEAASVYGGAGMNVAWNGTAWDPLGEIFSVTSISNAEIDTICV